MKDKMDTFVLALVFAVLMSSIRKNVRKVKIHGYSKANTFLMVCRIDVFSSSEEGSRFDNKCLLWSHNLPALIQQTKNVDQIYQINGLYYWYVKIYQINGLYMVMYLFIHSYGLYNWYVKVTFPENLRTNSLCTMHTFYNIDNPGTLHGLRVN